MTPWSVPRPFVLSDATARAIGFRPVTGYPDGAVAACRWLADTVPTDGWDKVLTGLAKYPYDMFDYAAEDDWLDADDPAGASQSTADPPYARHRTVVPGKCG